VPSVVTGAVADAEALLVVVVEVALDTRDELEARDELELALVHPDWQPTPQCADL
jgi:hypothetical protein